MHKLFSPELWFAANKLTVLHRRFDANANYEQRKDPNMHAHTTVAAGFVAIGRRLLSCFISRVQSDQRQTVSFFFLLLLSLSFSFRTLHRHRH